MTEVSKELKLPASQIHGLSYRRITRYLMSIVERAIEETVPQSKDTELKPVAMPLHQELVDVPDKSKRSRRKRRAAHEP